MLSLFKDRGEDFFSDLIPRPYMWPFSHENFHKISDAKESDIAKKYHYCLGEHPYIPSHFIGCLISKGILTLVPLPTKDLTSMAENHMIR